MFYVIFDTAVTMFLYAQDFIKTSSIFQTYAMQLVCMFYGCIIKRNYQDFPNIPFEIKINSVLQMHFM